MICLTFANNNLAELQVNVLRCLLSVPNHVPNSVILLETGQCPLIAKPWLTTFGYKSMVLKTRKEIPNESFVDTWFKQVTQKNNLICIDPDYLLPSIDNSLHQR